MNERHAAWGGLVLMAFGLIGAVAHGVVDILERAFHWQPNAFFGFFIILGYATWFPIGAKSSLSIVVESARGILSSWRGGPPAAGGGGV